MSQVINTNVMSLNAQRNLSTSGGQLAQALQRLSSGLRINSAKDDAAGLAISQRFTTQIRGLNQAIRNSNDGISLAQTGEGALSELANNLQRIRELAVQSANATNSSSDRAALNREVQQRLAEIDRVASQTSFNGQKILDGTFGDAVFQVGANVGETIGLALNTSMRQSDIGAVATATSVDLSEVISAGQPGVDGAAAVYTSAEFGSLEFDDTNATITITGPGDISETITLDQDYADMNALAAAFGGDGYTVTVDGDRLVFTADAEEDGTFSFGGADAALVTSGGSGTAGVTEQEEVEASTVTVNGDLTIQIGDTDAISVADGEYATVQALVDAINTALGGEASARLMDDGTLQITARETITIGGDVGLTTLGFDATNEAAGSLATVNVLDVDAANDAIMRIDSALDSVSDLRSTFGAIQNRFESTIANLASVVENLEASRSRIMDADFAAETAALTRAQVLQQAGVAMLSQANSMPQNVLALLR